MKKEETKITLRHGGMHCQKAYMKMKSMLTEHKFINPRLYHLIIMGAERTGDYLAARKALQFELKRKAIFSEWRACIEVDEDKGLHMHVYMLVEAKHINPCSVLNHHAQGWLNIMMQKRGLSYHIAPPKSKIHNSKKGKILNYATLAGEKLHDCLEWISYLVKSRSKPSDIKRIYFSSRRNAGLVFY